MSALVPATHRVVVTDRQAIVSTCAPRLLNGMSVGRTSRADAWELPAPLGRRGARGDTLVLQSGGHRKSIARVCQLPQPNRVEVLRVPAAVTTLGGSRSEDHASLISGTLCDEFRSYGAFLDYVTGEETIDSVVVKDGVHSWTTEVHLAMARRRFVLASQLDPPVEVIHRVRDRCIGAVVDLCGRLRCELHRSRRAIDVGRVQEVDDACIGWLARQAGKSLAERAGPRQRVLAVTRRTSHDTFENRVLALFLKLASAACLRYLTLQSARSMPTHPRVHRIEGFEKVVRELLRHRGLEKLPDPSPNTRPNHVLQFDRNYRAIWDGYQLLLAANKRDELVWRWRHRTFGEIVLLDLLAALGSSEWEVMAGDEVAEVGIREDPKCGHWLHVPRPFRRRRCRMNQREYEVELIAPLHCEDAVGGDCPIIDAVLEVGAVGRPDRVVVPLVALAGPFVSSSARSSSGDPIIVIPEGACVSGPDRIAVGRGVTGDVIEWPSDLRRRAQAAQSVFEMAANRLAGNGG